MPSRILTWRPTTHGSKRTLRFTMLSIMQDDIQGALLIAKEMWEQLKIAYGTTSTTRLRALTSKFDAYVMDPKHTMAKHLIAMSTIICELEGVCYSLIDKKQVTARLPLSYLHCLYLGGKSSL